MDILPHVIILLLIFGIGFSILVYHYPPTEGSTWLYVCFGVAVTLSGVTIFLDNIIKAGGGYWLVIGAPWAGFTLTGLPMVIGQLLKAHIDDIRNSNITVRGQRDHARIHRG